MAKGLRTLSEFDLGGQWDLITELPQDWGNRLLEGTNKTLCAPGPRTKEQWPHKRLSQTCLWVAMSLWWRQGLTGARCRVRGTDYNNATVPSFWRKSPLPPLPLPVWPCQTTEREHSPAHQQETGLEIYWACPAHQNKTHIPPQPVPPIGKLPQISHPYPSEGR